MKRFLNNSSSTLDMKADGKLPHFTIAPKLDAVDENVISHRQRNSLSTQINLDLGQNINESSAAAAIALTSRLTKEESS